MSPGGLCKGARLDAIRFRRESKVHLTADYLDKGPPRGEKWWMIPKGQLQCSAYSPSNVRASSLHGNYQGRSEEIFAKDVVNLTPSINLGEQGLSRGDCETRQ
jgi:hypothetical protein